MTEPVENDLTIIGDGPLAKTLRRRQHGDASKSGSRLVVIDEGDDARTLDRLRRSLEAPENSGAQFVAQIANADLRRAVETRLHMEQIRPRPSLVDAAGLTAEYFIARAGLFKMAMWRNQPRLKVALIGFGALGRALLEEVVLDGVAQGLGTPSIHILTPDVEEARALLRRDMPEIEASAQIVVAALKPAALSDATEGPVAQAEGAEPLTAILVALEEAGQTLAASAALSELQDRHGLAQAALFIGGPGARRAVALATPRRPSNNLGRRISAIGGLNSIPNLMDYILVERDSVARRLHEAYQTQYAGQTQGGEAWDDLEETYRRANRRAARNLTQKLYAIGVAAPEDSVRSGFVNQQTHDSLIAPLTQACVEDAVIRGLARLEHERWCSDRRLDGWRFGPARDDLRRLHPSLVPFDSPSLTADEIGKDIAQVRFVLGSVLQARADGATTRFVVGVIDAPDQVQRGVDASAIQARLSGEPGREAVIVSPLLTARELDATVDLARKLAAQGRAFLVVVPEWFAENRTLRDDAIAASPRLLELLAHPQTLIAPIGAGGGRNDDPWEDVSAADDARRALAAYIAKRAGALLAFE